jgi:membrane protease YdiL (CAAX protease family)
LSPESIAQPILIALTVFGVLSFVKRSSKQEAKVVNWSPSEAISVTVAIYFISQFVIALGLSMIVSITNMNEADIEQVFESSPAGQFGYILALEAITIGLLYLFMRRRKTPWALIGWVKPKVKDIWYALTGFGIYFVVYAVIVAQIVEQYLPIDTNQKQELGFSTSTAGPELIFIFLSLVILPPLIEEILVRGFLFTGLKTKLSFIPAAIITSIIFGAAHLQWGGDAPLLWTAAIDTFVLSMVLVYLRHRSGSLWPGIGLHFIKNGIAFLALFVFKVV